MLRSLAPLLLALAGDPIEKIGAHFRIVSELPQAALAGQALQAAEAVWPLAVEALGVTDAKLAAPLAIHLYADAPSYEQAEAGLTGGQFRKNLAFVHYETKSAHVALQPPASTEALEELGLPTLTAYEIAHEACHLVSYALVPNALDHPEWFADGMALNVAAGALLALGRLRSEDAEPLTAKSAVRAQALIVANTLPEPTAILAGELDGLELPERYAVEQLFYAFLRAEQSQELARAAATIRSLGGGADFAARLAPELEKVWSQKDRKQLAKPFAAYVARLRPEWDDLSRSLATTENGYVQRALTNWNAVAFRTQTLAKVPLSARGKVRVLPADVQQMNFLLGRDSSGYLAVAFTFGTGVSVFRYDTGEPGRWSELGRAACTLVPGKETAFRIEATQESLVVYVEEGLVLRVPLGGRSPLGAWGLGAQHGTTGTWSGLTVMAGK